MSADLSVIIGGDNPAMDTAVRDLMLLFAEWLDADQHILETPEGDVRSHESLVSEFLLKQSQAAYVSDVVRQAYKVYSAHGTLSNAIRAALSGYTLTKTA